MKKELYIIILMLLFVLSSCKTEDSSNGINSVNTEVQIDGGGAQFSDEEIGGVSDSSSEVNSGSNSSGLDINQ